MPQSSAIRFPKSTYDTQTTPTSEKHGFSIAGIHLELTYAVSFSSDAVRNPKPSGIGFIAYILDKSPFSAMTNKALALFTAFMA